jgi:hypothetical protein
MSLETSYKEFILEQILLEYLKDGIIPTVDQLATDLATYQKTHLDLSLPKSKYINFSVERGSYSSASTINSLVDTVSNDIIVSTKEIYNLADKNNQYYQRWQYELDRLSSRVNRLEDRVDSLLLLANNTEGYFNTVEDYFYDLSLVDTSNTTAKVDVSESKVTINPGTEAGSITQYNTNELTADDIAFYPLNRDISTTYYNTSTDNSLVQIFKTENSSWVGKIVSAATGPVTAELKIRLSQTDLLEISRISLSVSSPNVSSAATITLQYSEDGYNWRLIPSTEATKSFIGNLSWAFSPINMKWVKFIIYKPVHDSGLYEYIYSISSVKFFNNKYYENNGNTLISSALSSEDINGNKVGFFKAQLNTCQNIPEETSIDYYLAGSKDNSTWTSWHQIVPFSSKDTSYPKVINFTGISFYDNSSSSTSLLNSSYVAQQLVSSFTDTGVKHRFYKPNVAAINTKISIPSTIEEDIVANTIEVWRNIRVQDSYPDTLTVRDVPRGWNLEGQLYTCYFKIVSSSGKVIDFGESTCIIDGKEVNGIVNIPSGIHKFETTSDNWYDISSLVSEPIGDEEYIKTIDPLYPYNHKLLIEGIPYSIGFTGAKVYLGTDLSAGYYCKKTSLFDLKNKEDQLSSFVVKNIGTTSNILAVFLQYNPDNTDYVNERNLIYWKTGDSQTESYKYIKLKVELSSENTNISPELTGYRIKLGA